MGLGVGGLFGTQGLEDVGRHYFGHHLGPALLDVGVGDEAHHGAAHEGVAAVVYLVGDEVGQLVGDLLVQGGDHRVVARAHEHRVERRGYHAAVDLDRAALHLADGFLGELLKRQGCHGVAAFKDLLHPAFENVKEVHSATSPS